MKKTNPWMTLVKQVSAEHKKSGKKTSLKDILKEAKTRYKKAPTSTVKKTTTKRKTRKTRKSHKSHKSHKRAKFCKKLTKKHRKH